jgi:hypothetical protein
MSSPVPQRPVARALLCALGLVVLVPAAATAQPSGNIFVCVAASGRTITSDRLIAECMDREQRVLNRDGSVLRVIAPPLTAEERAAKEARERRIAADKLAQQDAVRRDRNLLQRYPTPSSHDQAREAALQVARDAMVASEARLAELANERKPLLLEAEFYKGRNLPTKLKQQFDANDAATDAQRTAVQHQRAELARINGLYDSELDRLKKLWAGAAPGSLGPLNETKPALASARSDPPP